MPVPVADETVVDAVAVVGARKVLPRVAVGRRTYLGVRAVRADPSWVISCVILAFCLRIL